MEIMPLITPMILGFLTVLFGVISYFLKDMHRLVKRLEHTLTNLDKDHALLTNTVMLTQSAIDARFRAIETELAALSRRVNRRSLSDDRDS
jgi:response regulator of citrate/malate metabolism